MAIWIGSPNYTPGRPSRPARISLHIMAGRLAGTDSVFQQSSRQASSTYGVGGDGTVHQYVREADTAWADGSYASNQQTISIEHEGGLDGVSNTDACVAASAALCADIARRYGWPKLEHGVNVVLHREIPPCTHPDCPDICPNPLRWQEIINQANQLLEGAGELTAQDLYDTKGSDGRNIFDSVIQTRSELRDRSQEGAEKALVELKGNDGRNVLDSVIQARYDIAELKTMLTAQSATIDTLAKAVGANPADIAQTVQQAVKAKLDGLKINITTEEAGK